MNYLSWYNGPRQTERFDPYLRQVLERRRADLQPRHTVENARERLLDPKDPIKKYGGDSTGLDRTVAQFIDDLVSFYYMGAAEYEFGAIPMALAFLGEAAKAEGLTASTFTATNIKPNWSRGHPSYDKRAAQLAKEKREKKPGYTKRIKDLNTDIKSSPTSVVLYYIGPKEYVQHIDNLVQTAARGEARNKNGDRHDGVFDPLTEWDHNVIGWLCVDYPFFLVKDREVFVQLHKLFFGREP